MHVSKFTTSPKEANISVILGQQKLHFPDVDYRWQKYNPQAYGPKSLSNGFHNFLPN